MNTFLSRLGLLFAALLPAVAQGQTYTNLYSFSRATGSPASNFDGSMPYCGLVLSANVFYGTTFGGGTNGAGGIFAVHTDGTHFSNLHSFLAITNGTNADGAQPYDTLVLSGNVLYGTASAGGTAGLGTVFRINTDGSAFTNLHNFIDGSGQPRAGLILASNVLYGTTYLGGSGHGSVFSIHTDGTGFTNLHSFTALANDAANPAGGLVLSGNTLFGTTVASPVGAGVVFALGADGSGYTNLFSFQVISGQGVTSTNKTGGTPNAPLLLLGNTLFGTAEHGGTNGNGVLFAINTNGSGFTNLHTFAKGTNNGSVYTNSDGFAPLGPLLLSGTNLYGTTSGGGTAGDGTIFSINTNGTGFSTVYTFVPVLNTNSVNLGGVAPANGLLFANGTFYGTTTEGGGFDGNIFGLSFGVFLNIQTNGHNVVLTWNNPAYSLQSATILTNNSFATIVGASSPYTNPITVPFQYFRLKGN
jgi:uncharacterized repeat protein (TIGR03803 family)